MEHVFFHLAPLGIGTQLHKIERRRDSSYPEDSIRLTTEARMPISGHHCYDQFPPMTRVARLTRTFDRR
jgi:hypothetical protein